MSDISPISRPNAAAVNGSAQAGNRVHGTAAAANRPADSVELSQAARYLSQLSENAPVREDLVARIRAQIANGTYETDDKINAALDAMTDDLV